MCQGVVPASSLGLNNLNRNKTNALTNSVLEEISESLLNLENNHHIKSVIITGTDKFFSYGFDINDFLSYSKEDFKYFVIKFTELYTYMFGYSKPLIAALNGHTIAGGCMLDLACDYRVMVYGKAKVSLNEINLGATVLAGSTEMLRVLVENKNSSKILYSGAIFSADEAETLDLIDEVISYDNLSRATVGIIKLR